MTADTPAVRLADLSKEFDELVAVDDVSLDIENQEFLTILGPSGAGKSTLLHMIAGFDTPTNGRIFIDGDDVTNAPPYERNIGMVFQSMALFPHMTVGENIAFPLEMRRFDPDRIDDRVAEMLELIRLPDIADRSVDELSGGQRQRVAMARSLAFEPSIMLLDEPLSSLDKKLREEMRRELLRIHRETDVTTIHVTHNQEEALSMANRIAVIRDGRVVQHASAQDLYDRPNSAFVAEFVGNTNVLAGRVGASTEHGWTVEIAGMDETLDYEERRCEGLGSAGSPVRIGLRYERLHLGESLATDVVLEGEIVDVDFEGDTITYDVELVNDGRDLSVTELKSPDARLYRRGDRVAVGWNDTDAFVYPATESTPDTEP